MTQFMQRYVTLETLIDVPTVPGPAPQLGLISGVVVPPGIYSLYAPPNVPLPTTCYDMTAEGFYLFHHPKTAAEPFADGGWRIVYQSDIYNLMSGLARIATYGAGDNALSIADLNIQARKRCLSLQCGNTCAWVKSILTSKGIASRIVRMVSAVPSEWDAGHVCIEVFVNGAWKLWDVANDRYFTFNDVHLSVRDYFDTLTFGVTPAPFHIARNERDKSNSNASIHTTIYWEMLLSTEPLVQTWIDRMYQIPGIVHTDNLTYFHIPAGVNGSAGFITNQASDYRVIDQAQWTAMFYH